MRIRFSLALFVLLLGLLGTGGFSQQAPARPTPVPLPEKNPEQSPDAPANPNSPRTPDSSKAEGPSSQPASAAKTFLGTIARVKEDLVLKESSTAMSYKLDDQGKAKPFEGKKVTVVGTLDGTNTIHIASIELTK